MFFKEKISYLLGVSKFETLRILLRIRNVSKGKAFGL